MINVLLPANASNRAAESTVQFFLGPSTSAAGSATEVSSLGQTSNSNGLSGTISASAVTEISEYTLSRKKRVVGGIPITRKGVYPWLMAIGSTKIFYYTGALIRPTWVNTTASCLLRNKLINITATSLFAAYGLTNRNNYSSSIQFSIVSQVILYPTRVRTSNDLTVNELALLKLDAAPPSTQYVCLPSNFNNTRKPSNNEFAVLIGYGTSGTGQATRQPQPTLQQQQQSQQPLRRQPQELVRRLLRRQPQQLLRRPPQQPLRRLLRRPPQQPLRRQPQNPPQQLLGQQPQQPLRRQPQQPLPRQPQQQHQLQRLRPTQQQLRRQHQRPLRRQQLR
ncbi:unnamed protein product, partial [Didymodactylos carnosus]